MANGLAFAANHSGDQELAAVAREAFANGLIAFRARGAGNGITLVNDITTPYFLEYCTDEQAERWMPGLASGELISAIAMTEPGTGSDLAGIQKGRCEVRQGHEVIGPLAQAGLGGIATVAGN